LADLQRNNPKQREKFEIQKNDREGRNGGWKMQCITYTGGHTGYQIYLKIVIVRFSRELNTILKPELKKWRTQ
jgi:hypothetical protein